MKMFGWLRGNPGDRGGDAVAAWRRKWTEAIAADGQDPGPLREQLDTLAAPGVDLELELEMLDGLERLRAAQREAAAGALPIVETHHRVIGRDTCHFTAPASLTSDAHQATGRLLLTSGRAVFVGGGRTAATPWHAVHEIVRIDRDLLLVRADRSPAAHFRFNTYGDALLCAFIAGGLKRAR